MMSYRCWAMECCLAAAVLVVVVVVVVQQEAASVWLLQQLLQRRRPAGRWCFLAVHAHFGAGVCSVAWDWRPVMLAHICQCSPRCVCVCFVALTATSALPDAPHARPPGLHHQRTSLYMTPIMRPCAADGADTMQRPQVACAVRDLHATGVVHFDLKCDNVLLLPEDAPPARTVPLRVLLADFGDALALSNDAGTPTWTRRHRGTELFSSPEMLLLHAGQQHPEHARHDRRKHRGVGSAHDVWSLGCLLFELMTGGLLFEAEVRW